MRTKLSFLNFILFTLTIGALFTSCKKEDSPVVEDTRKETANEVIVDANITSNRTFVKDSVYVLYGNIFVTAGNTLTIQPGTVIKGEKSTKGTLIITQGAKIMAQGTASAPIVFTSRLKPGYRASGDWGGLIIVGKAPVNQSSASVEGLTQTLQYGSSSNSNPNPHDNSGVLQYVRIEFAGIALQPDNEINGLTLCAVGDGTTIDHIQVSYSGDDSFEWFGGNVKAKYLIAYCGLDDDFDTDFGFSGRVQFALGVRSARIADVSTSNGFESDNDATGSAGQPKTKGIFSNVTLIGPYLTTSDGNVSGNFGAGAHIRRNSSLSVYNTVFAGWNTAGIKLDGDASYANAVDSMTLKIKNCAIIGTKSGSPLVGTGTRGTTAAIKAFYDTTGYGNIYIADNATAGITTSFYLATKTGTEAIPTSFLPTSASLLLTSGAYDTSTVDTYFAKTNYIGAFGTTDWTKESWVNFNPQNTVY